jgi:hypothetical protein
MDFVGICVPPGAIFVVLFREARLWSCMQATNHRRAGSRLDRALPVRLVSSICCSAVGRDNQHRGAGDAVEGLVVALFRPAARACQAHIIASSKSRRWTERGQR